MNNKTIGIISIKGGVGKTSVTSALGSIMAKEFGKKVLLVDANFSSPNLSMHLGMETPTTTIHHVIDNKKNIREAIYESSYGFDILPGAINYPQINPLKLAEKTRELRRKYDVILIDSSPNLNDELLGAMMACDELLVVTTPDHVTLATTIRAIKLAKEKRTPIAGIILNKVHNKKFELSLKQIEETSGSQVLGVLPYDLNVIKAISDGIPSTINKKLASTLEYRKLAASILGEAHEENAFKKFTRRFFSSVPKHEVNQTIFKNERRSNPFFK